VRPPFEVRQVLVPATSQPFSGPLNASSGSAWALLGSVNWECCQRWPPSVVR
jgi:hypothetical protein